MRAIKRQYLVTLVLLSGQVLLPAAANPAPSASQPDVGAIYTSFLSKYSGNGAHALQVAQSANAPSAQAVSGFSECARQNGATDVQWTNSKSIANLKNIITTLTYVRFINGRNWHPTDPGQLIAQGTSVNAAVAAGFAHALLTLSAVTFNKSHTAAVFTYSFECGALCGNGATMVFLKTSNRWVQAKQSCGNWMS